MSSLRAFASACTSTQKCFRNWSGKRGSTSTATASAATRCHARANGLYRVLVAGGSQPEGFLLDQDTAWPGALQRLLERPEPLLSARSIERPRRQHRPLRCRIRSARPDLRSRAASISAPAAHHHSHRRHRRAAVAGRRARRARPPARTADIFRCHPEGPFGWKPRELAVTELRAAGPAALAPADPGARARRPMDWTGARDAGAREGDSTDDARSRPDARPLRAPFPPRSSGRRRRMPIACSSSGSRGSTRTTHAEEAAHMWHGGVGQAWREDVTTYYSFDVVSRLMALVDAKAAGVGDGARRRAARPDADSRSQPRHVLRLLPSTPAGARAVATAVAAAVCGSRSSVARQRPRRRDCRHEPASVRDAGLQTMCGFAGLLSTAGFTPRRAGRTCRPHDRADRPSRPRRQRDLGGRAGRASRSAFAGSRSSTCRRTAISRCGRRPAASSSRSTARSTTSRSAPRARAARLRLSRAVRHRGHPRRLRAVGHSRRPSAASSACSRSRCGTRSDGSCRCCAIGSARSRCMSTASPA